MIIKFDVEYISQEDLFIWDFYESFRLLIKV